MAPKDDYTWTAIGTPASPALSMQAIAKATSLATQLDDGTTTLAVETSYVDANGTPIPDSEPSTL